MIVDENVLTHVKDIFSKLKRPMLERNLKQAEVPDVCTVLHNARGTAPGMWFSPPAPKGGLINITTESKQTDSSKKIFVSLPGVPNEMKGLMINEVLPRLKKEFILPSIVHKTVFTAGQGESFIAERIKDFETSLPSNIKLAYLPAYGMVRLRLTSRGNDKTKVEEELLPYFENLK
jgi:nicotinamide-nucleotide amidase